MLRALGARFGRRASSRNSGVNCASAIDGGGLKERPTAKDQIERDYIGPPDDLSNLRPIVRCILPNETALAARLRKERCDVADWNNEFWTKHNKRFYDEKEDFIRLHKLADSDISADKMSVFYKAFLDKNRRLHVLYNISWYIKNFNLLLLALQVHLQKLLPRKKNISESKM